MEQKHLLMSMSKAKAAAASPSPARKRRRAALANGFAKAPDAADQEDHIPRRPTSKRASAQRARFIFAAEETDDEEVGAPDWPPAPSQPKVPKAPALANGHSDKASAGPRGRAAVTHVLRAESVAVDGWGEDGQGSGVLKPTRSGAGQRRRKADDYDAEYDVGKVKKVRTKASGGSVEARDFDAAYQTKQRAGSGGSESTGKGRRQTPQQQRGGHRSGKPQRGRRR
jgi:hypothetical protein